MTSYLFGSDLADALQTQCRLPSPHPEDVVQGADWPEYEAGRRRRAAGRCGPRTAVMLADLWTGRPSALHGRSDPDEPDGAHGIQAAVAAG
jgi:hypothetical protein